MRNQVSHPYKATGRIMVLYILTASNLIYIIGSTYHSNVRLFRARYNAHIEGDGV
jgi:hypothetical protein